MCNHMWPPKQVTSYRFVILDPFQFLPEWKQLLIVCNYHHHVFHVSQLKGAKGFSHPVQTELPATLDHLQIPHQFVDYHLTKKSKTTTIQLLTHSTGIAAGDATWEDMVDLQTRFPHAPSWGQAGFKSGCLSGLHQGGLEDSRGDTTTPSNQTNKNKMVEPKKKKLRSWRTKEGSWTSS